ncbi:stress responsive A/B barrel domain protein [Paecilomyces variotii No. 5]|uniref:Stress responsive A/B barrel domain protein n=1 Tax=Byssochlamys spectabilis (strain No. 5 / NBRC 109023) TaxID=1356009 RepID=V5G2W4_BYSSN|nr:stress responsive A/B barrel domain protein [Paecilomyces variotii No. 5]
MTIVHIVMFRFKADASEAAIKDVCDRMLSLKDQCLHPTNKKPYIKSAVGGKENSPEKTSGGLTHIFVEEFENEEDRKYYLDKDPMHLAFVHSLGGLIEKAQVVDFTAGVF